MDAGHGRIETREAYVCADVGWLQERHAWPGLAAIGKVARTREAGGKIGRETAYFLLSAALPVRPLRARGSGGPDGQDTP